MRPFATVCDHKPGGCAYLPAKLAVAAWFAGGYSLYNPLGTLNVIDFVFEIK